MVTIDDSILLSDLDNNIIQFFNERWVNKSNSVFIYPHREAFLNLVVECLKNLELNFHLKNNPTRRSSVLIISRNRELFKKIKEMNVRTSEVFDYSKRYHEFLRKKDIFCDMNNSKFAMLYWRTYFSRYFENNIPETVPMYFVLPIASGRKRFTPVARGERNRLGKSDTIQRPAFIFTDTLKTVENGTHEFDFVFVDGTTIKANLNILEKEKTPYFIFLDNPLDNRTPYLLPEKNKSYVLDNFTLKRLVNINLVEHLEIPSVGIEDISFKYIKAPFENDLEHAFKLMDSLYKAYFNSGDLKIIRNLLYNAVRMSIEGIEYDFIAAFDSNYECIKDLIKELRDSDFRYESSDFEKVIELIEDIYNKHQLDTISPKYEALKEIITKSIKQNKKILVVSSGKIDSLGLKEKTSVNLQVDITELESQGVYIKSYQDIISMQNVNFDLMILTSAIRLSDLQPILKKNGKKVIVLLYQLVIRQLKSKLNPMIDIKNELSFSVQKVVSETIYEKLYKKIRRIDTDKNKGLEVEIDSILDSINLITPNFSNRLTKPYVLENAVKTKLIIFADGSKVFLREGSAIKCLQKSKKVFKEKHVKELEGNEEILIINNDIKKDLYEIFISNLSEKTMTKQHYKNIKEWREMYEDKYIFLKLDDNRLFENMVALGWNKSTKGILKNWRSGYSYGPRDLEDIKVLGKVLNLSIFTEEPEYFYKSMIYIRTERRVAARILNKIIYLSKGSIDSTDDKFLANYNLSLEDIQEAIKIKKIESISEKIFKVKPSEVGCIFN